MNWVHCIAAAACLLSGVAVRATPAHADELWSEKIQPLLDRYCFKCHGGGRQKSGLDFRFLETILKGGERGPAIVSGHPEESHLYPFVLEQADPHMPVDEKKQLNADEIEIIRTWIAALPATNIVQAEWTDREAWAKAYVKAFAALQPRIWNPPEGISAHEAIDGFLQRAWQAHGIEPSPTVDAATFARRISLDLAVRIPSLPELDAFLDDRAADKRACLADALLASADYPR